MNKGISVDFEARYEKNKKYLLWVSTALLMVSTGQPENIAIPGLALDFKYPILVLGVVVMLQLYYLLRHRVLVNGIQLSRDIFLEEKDFRKEYIAKYIKEKCLQRAAYDIAYKTGYNTEQDKRYVLEQLAGQNVLMRECKPSKINSLSEGDEIECAFKMNLASELSIAGERWPESELDIGFKFTVTLDDVDRFNNLINHTASSNSDNVYEYILPQVYGWASLTVFLGYLIHISCTS